MDNSAFSVAVGEQRTRGAEIGIASDLRNGLSLFGGYANTDSEIADAGAAGASTVGRATASPCRRASERTALLTVGYRH